MALALDVIPGPQPPPSTVDLLPARCCVLVRLARRQDPCLPRAVRTDSSPSKPTGIPGSDLGLGFCSPRVSHWRQTSPALSAHPSWISKLAACSVSHSFPDVRHRLGDLRATWMLIVRRPPIRVRVTDFCITNPSFLTPPQPPS